MINDGLVCANCNNNGEYWDYVDEQTKVCTCDAGLYPKGKDLLWEAVFRKDRNVGKPDGFAVKISGTLEEAAKEAEHISVQQHAVLQMLHRRY